MPRLARGKPIFSRFARRPPLSDRVFGVFVQRTGRSARLSLWGSGDDRRQRPCPLRLLRSHLSHRERHWRVGQAHAGRAKFGFIINSSALLQRAAASEQYPCQAAVNLCSRALSFYVISGFRCPVESDPAYQWLSLWGQRRRPPPAAETGRSCWGSGQQDASDSVADAGSRNPALARQRLRGLLCQFRGVLMVAFVSSAR